jgi:iron complex transport system substrate-binding protein
MGNSVVGLTRQCDYPPEAAGIDAIGSFQVPDMKLILELSPDVIVGISSLHKHAPGLVKSEETGIILFDYHSVRGVLDVMEAVSSLAQDTGPALGRVASLRRRVNALEAKNEPGEPVRTLFLISESPVMTPVRGSYQYDALRIAGARQLPDSYAQYERVTMEEIVYFDPEIVLACGRHRGEAPRQKCPDCHLAQPICQRVVEDIAAKPGWQETSAARNGHVHAVACHHLCRPGPRLVDGMESIAATLRDFRNRNRAPGH